jgi:hypothetical protein
LTSIVVDDQGQAEQLYNQVLGLQVKTSAPYGPQERWAERGRRSRRDPAGAAPHRRAGAGIPAGQPPAGRPVLSLRTADCAGEVERLKATGWCRSGSRPGGLWRDGRGGCRWLRRPAQPSPGLMRCRAAPPTPSGVGSCWCHAARTRWPGHEDHSVQTTATKPAGAAIALEPRRRRRSEHLEHSLPDEEIEDVTTEDAHGPDDANGFLAPERAGAMTATLADVICGAVLDEQATPGERALNNGAPPLNAPRSTTRGHSPAPAEGAARHGSRERRHQSSCGGEWRCTTPDTATGVEVTRCSMDQARDARRHHRGASGASGADRRQRRQPPTRSTDARPPAGSCPTDLTHPTSRQACQAHRIPAAVTAADRPKEVPVSQEGRACWSPGQSSYQGRQGTRRSNQPGLKELPVARALRRPGGAQHRPTRGGPRCDHDGCSPFYQP